MTKMSEAVERVKWSMHGNLIAEVHVGDLATLLSALEERTAALKFLREVISREAAQEAIYGIDHNIPLALATTSAMRMARAALEEE